MFLNHLTMVDHAFVDDTGRIRGGSVHPDLLVSGNVDPEEKVVVDFSTIKKDLKNYIDDDQVGFDHKCWIIEGYSNVTELRWLDTKTSIDDFNEANGDNLNPDPEHGERRVWIKTPTMEMILPKNAIKFIPADPNFKKQGYTYDHIASYIERFLNDICNPEGLSIDCKINEEFHARKGLMRDQFRYVHGLKNSTSWGCQNLAHGHLSFLEVKSDDVDTNQSQTFARKINNICKDLHDTIFVMEENIVEDTEDFIRVRYSTEDRGFFEAVYYKDCNKLVRLNTETTVEFLVEYVADHYKEEFKRCNVNELFVSEGLSKGAYKKI